MTDRLRALPESINPANYLCTLVECGDHGNGWLDEGDQGQRINPLPFGVFIILLGMVANASNTQQITAYWGNRHGHPHTMIVVPSTREGSWQSSWRVYSIDPINRKFVNVGPANGAVFVSHTIESYTGWKSTGKPSLCTNIRADENGQLPNLLAGHRITINRMYPDKKMCIFNYNLINGWNY